MDGYTLTEKMRKARRRFRFTATEQALFYELVAICNGEDWTDVFDCSNPELCVALNIDEKTLVKARDRLISAKLIYYKSGKSRRIVSSYSFVKPFKITGTTTGKNTVVKPTDEPTDQPADAPDYNKHKTETKPNTPLLISPKGYESFDFSFVLSGFEDLFFMWLAYKASRQEKYKNQKSIQLCFGKLLKLSDGIPEKAKEIVEESMANNWAGLFELKNERKHGATDKKNTESTNSVGSSGKTPKDYSGRFGL